MFPNTHTHLFNQSGMKYKNHPIIMMVAFFSHRSSTTCHLFSIFSVSRFLSLSLALLGSVQLRAFISLVPCIRPLTNFSESFFNYNFFFCIPSFCSVFFSLFADHLFKFLLLIGWDIRVTCFSRGLCVYFWLAEFQFWWKLPCFLCSTQPPRAHFKRSINE